MTISDDCVQRSDILHSTFPELKSMYAGQELSLAGFPELQHIIQTGHSAIPGVNRFKDLAVYTSPNMSSYEMPVNSPDDLYRTVLRGGKVFKEYSNGDFVNVAQKYPSSNGATAFSACSFQPICFASLLSSIHHGNKHFVPGVYNMTEILTGLPRQ